MKPNDNSFAASGVETRREKDDLSSDGKISSSPPYRNDYLDQTEGEVFDPYGGKKIGMFRVRIAV
jgi:hypothetical protein